MHAQSPIPPAPARPISWRSLRLALLAAAALLLAACSHAPQRNPIAQWVPSDNHDARRPVLVVLHFTDQDSVQRSLDTLRTRNAGGRVSAHYLVGRDGDLYQLVSDERRAWHAGAGSWGTIGDVNSASIGIEIDNDGHSPFPPAQVQTLIALLEDLCTRWRIPRSAIIGHEDLAPTRKRDPGPLFPWKTLAEAGFGLWPAADAPPAPAGFDPWLAMRVLGYPIADRSAAVRAFRSRYRGDELTTFDSEDLRILHALTLYPEPAVLRPAAAEGDLP